MHKIILGFDGYNDDFKYYGIEGYITKEFYNTDSATEIIIKGYRVIPLKNYEDVINYGGATKSMINTYITKIIFNGPVTIVFFRDGSKEIVKCSDMSKYDAEKGILYAFMKHVLNIGRGKKTYNNNLKMIDRAVSTAEQIGDFDSLVYEKDMQEPKKR